MALEVKVMAALAKNNRIDLRLSDADKNKVEMAANLKNLSLSNYILNIVLKQAELDLVENEEIQLTSEQSKMVFDLLENPPEPTQDLLDLFKK